MVAVDEVGGPCGTRRRRDQELDAVLGKEPVDPLASGEPQRNRPRALVGSAVGRLLGLLEKILPEPSMEPWKPRAD